ncbi:hypothetical protein A2U01_0009000, partial [Trifolium medium]|nr:hypothetical protein [Trifolium medium]
MPPEEDVNELGKFFASQYYGLLCREPDQMRRFYAQHSTMIRVIDGNDTTIILGIFSLL